MGCMQTLPLSLTRMSCIMTADRISCRIEKPRCSKPGLCDTSPLDFLRLSSNPNHRLMLFEQHQEQFTTSSALPDDKKLHR
jgi:hypothetical protein